ncbi:Na+/H+ antiporter NhaA [Thermasporomyces composti]|jgi:Na+/H+ antiporter NhaA|uniref:Na(+)/H(+) antiporter NhaA n=1 Tax=Thermasporomyces composti TaxID=696763 RepID=A0A3D9VD43_THECX|nr:Na+/H+ antiporter NhaA [Thermasporomyces composti]REF38080.1 sodium/proton antiporter (NhaA family) [Thermasporomyces composti]
MSEPPRPGPELRIHGPWLSPSVRSFLANETGGAFMLLLATMVALAWANSPWWETYEVFWRTPVSVSVGQTHLDLSVHDLVNDGAMALFFLVLGLEINEQLTTGSLRDRRTVMVPAFGALGGVAVPIAIYLAINPSGDAVHGWGTVMSTDTAFVLGILALFGPECPDALRLFLLTLAVVDDVVAITLMAVFYSSEVQPWALLAAAVIAVTIMVVRWIGVWRLTPYVLLGIALWAATFRAGVHPTLAGVLMGLLVSMRPTGVEHAKRLRIYGRALLEERSAERARMAQLAVAATVPAGERLQRAVHPWTAYVIVPVFGLANAGVHLDAELLRAAATSPVSLGVVAGLVVGKVVGISGASALALRTRLGVLPGQVRYSHLVGGAALSGIGFTISLFIAELAFGHPVLREEATIGILIASLVSAVAGSAFLRLMGRRWSLCSPESETPPDLPPPPWTAPERP